MFNTHTPAAVVVPTHEHLSPPTADGAVGLIAIIIVLIRALQEAVLHAQQAQSELKSQSKKYFLWVISNL